MNKVILVGRLTKDVEVKMSQSGTAIARFTLAVNRMKKDDPTDFINCVAFNKTAEFLEQWTKKGYQILVDGRIQTGSYEKDGAKVYTTDIMVERVENLTPKKSEDSQTSQTNHNEEPTYDIDMISDDEMPF